METSESSLLERFDEFCVSCSTFLGGVVYRMATQRRLVAAIAECYAGATMSIRSEFILRLAAATSEFDHRYSRSVVEILLAAAASLQQGPVFPIMLRADLLRLLSRKHDVFGAHQLNLLQQLDSVLRWLFLRQSAVGVRRFTTHESEPLLSFLERVEAVHPLTGGRAELLRRLGGDCGRIAFGLFFASMPETPLSVVYVAVGPESDPPVTVSSILCGNYGANGGAPVTACFYSITNCIDGLQGLQLGSYLIFLAMEELRMTWPCLSSFVTLSPIPLFGAWLRARLALERQDESRMNAELERFTSAALALSDLDTNGREEACTPWLRQQLARYAAHFILFERINVDGGQWSGILRAPYSRYGKCIDPVANFHISNGSLVDNILCCADLSARGLAASYGCMVNYRYDAEFLSGRAPVCRYTAQGTLCSYRAARLLVPIINGGPDIFDGLDLDVLKRVLVSAPVIARVCKAGEIIARPDAEDTLGFHVVVAGSVDVVDVPPDDCTAEHSSRPRIMCSVSAGQALAILPEPPSSRLSFAVRASTDCRVVFVPRETVLHLYQTRPEDARLLWSRAIPIDSTTTRPRL